MKFTWNAGLLCALALSAGGAWAQASDPHAGHAMPAAKADAASEAYAAAHAKMHKDMAIEPSSDADRDFLAAMIPHHQGAIDMAEIELRYGKDPKVRKLALAIIRAQKHEIALMREWLQAKSAGKR